VKIVILATYYDRFVIIRQSFLINLMKKLSKKVKPGKTEMKIYYNEGEQIKDPRLLKTSKISFHASVRIRYAGDQLISKPLRILKEQHELCIVLFCHPAK
jgi:hypothetical protein